MKTTSVRLSSLPSLYDLVLVTKPLAGFLLGLIWKYFTNVVCENEFRENQSGDSRNLIVFTSVYKLTIYITISKKNHKILIREFYI